MKFSEATKLRKWEENSFQETVSYLPFLFSSSLVAYIRKLRKVYLPEFRTASQCWLTASLGLSHSQWEQLLLRGFQTNLKQRVAEFRDLSAPTFCNIPQRWQRGLVESTLGQILSGLCVPSLQLAALDLEEPKTLTLSSFSASVRTPSLLSGGSGGGR